MKQKVENLSIVYHDVCKTNTNQLNVVDLQNSILEWNQKAKEIQSHFDFDVPMYIIDEIIEKEDCVNHENLYCLINCAVMNGKISQENARKIKEVY